MLIVFITQRKQQLSQEVFMCDKEMKQKISGQIPSVLLRRNTQSGNDSPFGPRWFRLSRTKNLFSLFTNHDSFDDKIPERRMNMKQFFQRRNILFRNQADSRFVLKTMKKESQESLRHSPKTFVEFINGMLTSG
jgi:hypothetical protein